MCSDVSLSRRLTAVDEMLRYHRLLAGNNNLTEAETSVRQFVIFLLIVGMCASLSACSKRVKTDPRQLTALVSIEGSDTMTALVKAWAANFMKK